MEFAIVMFILAYFSTHWRMAGKRVDLEQARIARELADFDLAVEIGKRETEKYCRKHGLPLPDYDDED